MTKKLLLGLVATLVATMSYANLYVGSSYKSELLKQNFGKENAIAPKQSKSLAAQKTAEDAPQVFVEDFEDFAIETNIPNGWSITDNGEVEMTMQSGHIESLTQGMTTAVYGDYGLFSMFDSSNPRNSWAISPAVTLEAGVTYTFGIYAWHPGYNGVNDEWKLTIGNAATIAAQTTVIIDKSGANATSATEWTLYQGTFTPATAGTYYIGINHCTSTTDVNIVMWDYLQVVSDHLKFPPQGKIYSIGGLWSFDPFYGFLPCMYVAENEEIQYGYVAENCESVEWDFDKYANVSDPTAANPIVTYSLTKDSVYNDLFLSLYNDGIYSSEMRSFNIKKDNSKSNYADFVSNLSPEEEILLYLVDETNNYISLCSMCDKYTKIAEHYNRPATAYTTIEGVNMIVPKYKLSLTNRKKELTFKVQKSENGMPGRTLYTESVALTDIFGTGSVTSWDFFPFQFSETVDVRGPFFITIEFPEVEYGQYNHLTFGTSEMRGYDNCTLFFYNDNNISGISNGWHKASEYYQGANVSASIYTYMQFNDLTGVENAVVNNSKVFANEGQIVVLNAHEGDEIVVTDIAGRVVLKENARAMKTILNNNLNSGIYIVTVEGVATKIVL